ncbi:MAG: HEPN domain-containing protein [Parasphingorhabdus sp.]
MSGYFSDYDLLVIVNDEAFTDITDYWSAAIDRMAMEAMREGVPGFAAMPQVIVHSFQDVNSQLSDGRYFFRDIVAEGIELYALAETKGGGKRYQLAEARNPDPLRASAMAKDYFELWSGKARDALEVAEFSMQKGMSNEAAFNLHQATERAYTCYLLTKTLYSPATHNLLFLRSQCEEREESLRDIWPNEKPHKRHFELLKKAYVEARYSKHYAITVEELAWLKERVELLLERVEGVCGD